MRAPTEDELLGLAVSVDASETAVNLEITPRKPPDARSSKHINRWVSLWSRIRGPCEEDARCVEFWEEHWIEKG